jgi:myo-inositol catabolism protein IolC
MQEFQDGSQDGHLSNEQNHFHQLSNQGQSFPCFYVIAFTHREWLIKIKKEVCHLDSYYPYIVF